LHLHQSVIISFVKKPPPDPREYLVQPLAQATCQTKQFFLLAPAPPRRWAIFQTIRRAHREAGTRPRFKWRAGTPHPPLHQPSGAESTTMNGSSKIAAEFSFAFAG
jgi:hypothetical protein